jgi:DNA-binding MarR family transcriptional regulator
MLLPGAARSAGPGSLSGSWSSPGRPHASLGDIDHATQLDVLNTLRRRGDQQGINPSDLAASSLVTTGAMSSRLERVGLIRRTPDPADGRAIRVRLTARGERLAEQALQAVIAADEAFLQPLDQPQRDAVASALKLLLLPYETG